MPRLPRIDDPGVRHLVTNRGARRANVFLDEVDREVFLSLLAEFPRRFGVAVYGWSLNPNHYHLLLQSVDGQLSRAMRTLGGEYTRRTNRRHGWDGPLFKGRFHNRAVDSEEYWRYLLFYVHHNPVKDGFFDDIDRCPWTSHRYYTGAAEPPPWLTVDEHLELFGSVGAYRRFCAEAAQGGQEPPGFDEERLWSPHHTLGAPTVPPVDHERAIAHGLEQLGQVTGLSVDELRFARRGRSGSPATWLTAWWLSRRQRVVQRRIAEICGVSAATISKRIRQAEDRRGKEEPLTGWMEALERLPLVPWRGGR